MGQLFSNLFAMRQSGDYGTRLEATDEEIAEFIVPTENFVKKVAAMAKSHISS